MKVFKATKFINKERVGWVVCGNIEDAIELATADKDEMEIGDYFTIKCINMSEKKYNSMNEFDGF